MCFKQVFYKFPEVTEAALRDRAPHTVVTYLTELAGEFNSFYAHEMIADASDTYAPYEALLAGPSATTLKNGLWVLGIRSTKQLWIFRS